MRLNLRLVWASQFLQQFKLNVRHKPKKEHIISNTLSRLTSAGAAHGDPHYSELNVLYVYNITFIEIYPNLVSQILAGYNSNLW